MSDEFDRLHRIEKAAVESVESVSRSRGQNCKRTP